MISNPVWSSIFGGVLNKTGFVVRLAVVVLRQFQFEASECAISDQITSHTYTQTRSYEVIIERRTGKLHAYIRHWLESTLVSALQLEVMCMYWGFVSKLSVSVQSTHLHESPAPIISNHPKSICENAVLSVLKLMRHRCSYSVRLVIALPEIRMLSNNVYASACFGNACTANYTPRDPPPPPSTNTHTIIVKQRN